MLLTPVSPCLERLRGRITLDEIPFTDRGSRLRVWRNGSRLFVRLVQRGVSLDKQGHTRPQLLPLVDDLALRDENGTLLDFELVSFPHALFLTTRIGIFALAFIDETSLYLHLPEKHCGVAFRIHAAQGQCDRRGGVFARTSSGDECQRNVAYTTNARILSNCIRADVDGYAQVELQLDAAFSAGLTLNITPYPGLNRSVPQVSAILRETEKRWHAWFSGVPTVPERYADAYYFAWWALGASLLIPEGHLTREVAVASPNHEPVVRAWDALFYALAYRHLDARLAENQLRVLMDQQREDGLIPGIVSEGDTLTPGDLPAMTGKANRPAPPLMAWAALKLYDATGHLEFLDEIYEPLCRSTRWWVETNDDDQDGIVQSNYPESSNLAESPLWSGRIPMESPDLNTFLVMEMDALARIADMIDVEEADQWRTRAERLTLNLISHSWSTRNGVFWATRNHRPIRMLTAANLYPLLTGRLSPPMTERLVAHLFSPEEFWTPNPLATIARPDARYDPQQRGKGAAWISNNCFFVEGLERCGYSDHARQLRDRTLDLLMQRPNLYECYDAETGAPVEGAASAFGPTSALFVDLLQAIREEHGQR